ncbi:MULTISPECIES: hypothetical protein [Clostridium]|uniref:hypothetical protein n=1 Tax=Clostridium TaxID=1485 RepID=UPI00189A8124|nr:MULTISPECIES: hypothetical protein [Clostridium]MDB2094464.1 hypothetical protein [Clostridium paraputrificum]MDB2105090.1 hypothetical protein [Clostridium paraputrificum]MDB2118685.1 hypothetical protein [Clostridium paraputrificum]MDC0804798.1 hypothetical protein [Clostridium paraputrificum]MDU1937993.1 hypothetical protein [Clostridium sp.]
MSNNKIIKKIQDGLYVDEELQEFLKINNVFVLSNTMKEIVKLQYKTDFIINRLIEISKYREREHVLIGVYTIGHLAIATLLKLGIKKEELDCYNTLDDYEKGIVSKLVEGYEYVI